MTKEKFESKVILYRSRSIIERRKYMFIAGPFTRDIEVTIPVGDSRRTVAEYKTDALELANFYASKEGYPVIESTTEWDPDAREVSATVTVEVYAYFEDEEAHR